MAALIDKDDFGALVRWSDNLPASAIDTHILNAQKFDVRPVMPVTKTGGVNMLDNIETAVNESPVTKPELVELFNDYVKPLLVFKAYAQFLLWHGTNVVQYGLRRNIEDTSENISDKLRAELIADTEAKANSYLAEFKKALEDASYTFDDVVYQYSGTKPKAKTRISAV